MIHCSNEFLGGNVTIFAGAGISTESSIVLPQSFYESVIEELNLSDCDLSFPELMELYCRQPNGRINLVKKIKGRFSHIESFPELYRAATRFHSELATLYPIKTIVTTNWDTYFEDVCGAVPFVTDQDTSFWDIEDRRVLKIHGSITNYGSIVATSSDYKKRAGSLSTGLVGTLLKSILATQTVVFIGYSLRDTDFRYIYDFVRKQLKDFHRQSYVVTTSVADGERFKQDGFLPIVTDGTFFIQQLKKHCVATGVLLSDEIYGVATSLLDEVYTAHCEMHEIHSFADHPQLIYASSYQDGICHALERMVNMRRTGEYSDPTRTRRIVDLYLDIRKDKLKNRIYEDVAYVDGYINGLAYTLFDDEKRMRTKVQLYYGFGVKHDITSPEQFSELLPQLPQLHKASFRRARNFVKSKVDPGGLIFHHPPWL